ncbi:rhodanese-like domain-containing protein [Thiospirillum jenense]|uniref:Rhodanese-like domain-containing protein n=1 Tax=Thiospirillum jenense TaxID=1653858 RepID=A0A839H8H8_9GAMM|nr:rhodanese-like domain-containing protein [Thiospirillum jenense]MBB1125314.1 rhodanese-like domain-containing protein [Thiospirillum jenense]
MFVQLLEFVGNHWVLFIALAVVVGLLTHNFIVGSKGVVDPAGATELINRRDATVIDVRASADFAKGHIMNAVNIPMNGFKNQTAALTKYRDKPIVISCHSGNQSQLACILLRKAGFPEVYNLRGGIMAWQNANLPLTRK